MKKTILALRVSRRALAAVAIDHDGLPFQDGRHLTSKADRALVAAERYVRRVLEVTKPDLVVIDAPLKDGSLTSRLQAKTEAILGQLQIVWEPVAVSDVLSAYGVPALRTRSELRRVVEPLWPELAHLTGKVKPYVVEAAAVAFHADTCHRLGLPPPA